MEVTLDLGAKVDIATGQDVCDLRDDIDALGKRKPARPFYNSGIASNVIPAGNAPLVLDLGSPATGRIWNILGVTVLGADDATVLANAKAALYLDADPIQPGLAACAVPSLAIPVFNTFSDKVLWCHSNGNVVVNVTGTAVAGSAVIAKVYYADWAEAAVSGNSGR